MMSRSRGRRQFLGASWKAISGLVIGGLFLMPTKILAQVSGLGQSRRDIEELYPDATVLDGLAIFGEDATEAQAKVLERLRGMRLS
jgi:hypothetical protein